jgi:ribosomal protein L7/L12
MAGNEALVEQIAACYPNNKIAAIKLVREATDLSLKDAKELVDGLFEDLEGFQGQALLKEIGIWIDEEIEIRRGGSTDAENGEREETDWRRELARFQPDGKIEAIKHVREKTGLGLKEAKDLVEAHWNRVKVTPAPGRTGDEAPDYEVRSKSSPLLLLILLAVLVAAIAWYFLGR